MFSILAADKLAKAGLAWIESQPDADLVYRPGLGETELAELVADHDALIVRSEAAVTARVLARPGRLRVIARAGVGVDNIDLEAATAAGILVVNSADASTVTTAEHTLTLLMALARNIGPAFKNMTDGRWDRSRFQGVQIAGKTLGIVGFGRIGQAVAHRALALDMKVVGFDPFVNVDTMLDGQVQMFRQFHDLLGAADILTFHVPLDDQTRSMLSADQFKHHVKRGVLIINASRGGVVDERSLREALEDGTCGGAALDVFETEPWTDPFGLLEHPKVLTTPHLGASTAEAQEAVALDAAAAAMAYLRGQPVKGAVNAAGLRTDLSPRQQQYADLASRMARLIDPMLTEGIGKVSVQVAGHELAAAAETFERICLVGLLAQHLSTPVNVINVRHIAEQRGIVSQAVSREEDTFGPHLAIEISCGDQLRRIVGRVYDDLKPRVVEINGYHMDMIPAGDMVLLQNADRPGMIGLVGTEFGAAKVNIADMSISRRDTTALMLLKIDAEAPTSLIDRLKTRPGIYKVATVRLPAERTERLEFKL